MAKTDLALTPETDGVLWTVQTWAGTYLVVRCVSSPYGYQVHKVGGEPARVEWVADALTQTEALVEIEKDLNS